jgi:hypothetical protein
LLIVLGDQHREADLVHEIPRASGITGGVIRHVAFSL